MNFTHSHGVEENKSSSEKHQVPKQALASEVPPPIQFIHSVYSFHMYHQILSWGFK